ncbi:MULTISPECIES: DinB family protein [Niastella]|uniref:DinB family protein n=1 Tax=Niastella soli TaxID=2821487 RepID=A0ABS3YR92_9BACT|nr:DinB family protein [Niastella soli]MBO9200444.1 DinB family protein [Niastella soli]
MNLQTALTQLEKHIQEVPQHFNQFAPEVLLSKPAPDKWSKKEILGHLIDSAINNLKRFTDTQYFPQPYTIIRYNQDELVIINRYQQLPLDHLLQLWSVLNKQIANIISAIPADKLPYTVIIPSGESKTLEWIAIDYVEHLEHHLKQIG